MSEVSTYDKEVKDCLRELFAYMACSVSFEVKKNEFFNEFENKYNLLTNEQQQLIKLEYLKMIETQNNIVKMKKKGMIRYE